MVYTIKHFREMRENCKALFLFSKEFWILSNSYGHSAVSSIIKNKQSKNSQNSINISILNSNKINKSSTPQVILSSSDILLLLVDCLGNIEFTGIFGKQNIV